MTQSGGIRRGWTAVLLVAAAVLLAPAARGEQGAEPRFAGWERLHVMRQEGFPDRLRVADLEGLGRESLLLVNSRHARIEILRWRPLNEREPVSGRRSGSAVNELPLPAEFERVEVPVGQVPADVAVLAADERGQPSLLVLVSNPNRLLRLTFEERRWQQESRVDLLPGRWSGVDGWLRLWPEPRPEGGQRVLISTDEGFQVVDYDASGIPEGRARWLEPRESSGRQSWWPLDLDADGVVDLVEWTQLPNKAVRWYRGSASGLLPAQTLHAPQVAAVQPLQREKGHELLILESTPAGVVRRYGLEAQDPTPVGREFPLSLPGGEAVVWTLAELAGELTLVVADPVQPRLLLFPFDPAVGWRTGESYPSVGRVQQLVAGAPDELLLWTTEGADLYQTRWHQGRLAFPQLLESSDDPAAGERLILGLGRLESTLWWIQRRGEDLWLHVRTSGEVSASRTRFAAVAGKAEKALWLGGEQLLVADKFARGLRLVRAGNADAAMSLEPSHLNRARLEEFHLMSDPLAPGKWQVARLMDGVLQWLDDELQPSDQVMLPDGQRLMDFAWAPLTLQEIGAPRSAWALVQGGNSISRMVADSSGVLRETDRYPVEEGRSLQVDPRLGLILSRIGGVTVLSEGRPWQLSVRQQLDLRSSQPLGLGEMMIHRIETLDLLGRGRDDALLLDFAQHRLNVFSDHAAEQEAREEFAPLASWQVFEDSAYPYGRSADRQVREPRAVVTLDIDGDGVRDLAMLSHDRLLIYQGREPAAAPADPQVASQRSGSASPHGETP